MALICTLSSPASAFAVRTATGPSQALRDIMPTGADGERDSRYQSPPSTTTSTTTQIRRARENRAERVSDMGSLPALGRWPAIRHHLHRQQHARARACPQAGPDYRLMIM